jgi:hypothetical protein
LVSEPGKADLNGDAPEDDESTPFERFEELARRLVAVPKHELDAEREARRPPR